MTEEETFRLLKRCSLSEIREYLSIRIRSNYSFNDCLKLYGWTVEEYAGAIYDTNTANGKLQITLSRDQYIDRLVSASIYR